MTQRAERLASRPPWGTCRVQVMGRQPLVVQMLTLILGTLLMLSESPASVKAIDICGAPHVSPAAATAIQKQTESLLPLANQRLAVGVSKSLPATPGELRIP